MSYSTTPVPLSVQYLYAATKSPWLGIDHLDHTTATFIGVIKGPIRAVYSLGILIIGPLGSLGHLLAAGYVQCQLRTAAADLAKQMQEKKVQHLNAAGYDIAAFGSTVLSVVMISLAVMTVSMGFTTHALAMAFFGSMAIYEGGIDLCLSIRYMFDFTFYSVLLDYDKPLQKAYDAALRVHLLTRLGYVEQSLNDVELGEITKAVNGYNRWETAANYKLAVRILTALKTMSKIKHDKEKEVNFYIEQEKDFCDSAEKCNKKALEQANGSNSVHRQVFNNLFLPEIDRIFTKHKEILYWC